MRNFAHEVYSRTSNIPCLRNFASEVYLRKSKNPSSIHQYFRHASLRCHCGAAGGTLLYRKRMTPAAPSRVKVPVLGHSYVVFILPLALFWILLFLESLGGLCSVGLIFHYIRGLEATGSIPLVPRSKPYKASPQQERAPKCCSLDICL